MGSADATTVTGPSLPPRYCAACCETPTVGVQTCESGLLTDSRQTATCRRKSRSVDSESRPDAQSTTSPWRRSTHTGLWNGRSVGRSAGRGTNGCSSVTRGNGSTLPTRGSQLDSSSNSSNGRMPRLMPPLNSDTAAIAASMAERSGPLQTATESTSQLPVLRNPSRSVGAATSPRTNCGASATSAVNLPVRSRTNAIFMASLPSRGCVLP
jgi:hypothetical protein